MINHLYVKNFVLIDELSLDLRDGFSVFTGETGAGKSILIDAISLICADRASTAMIAKGKDKAVVEGTFSFAPGSHALQVLEEAGFEAGDEVTFTREIHSSGKGVVRIDRRIATLSLMKEILDGEIDIHGQRDTQYLLNTNTHIRLLDQFLKLDDLRVKTAEAYTVLKNCRTEKEKALQEVYNENDLEYLMYQIREIEQAKLKIGEDEELQEQEREYKAVRSSIEKLDQIIALYDRLDSDLYDLNRMVSSLPESSSLEKTAAQMNDGYYAVSDAAEEIRKVRDAYSLSEDDINAMEERLYLLQRLKRKYGGSIETVLSRLEEMKEQVRMIEHRQEYLDEIDKRIKKAHEAFKVHADEIHKQRTQGAGALEKAIIGHLRDLSLPEARFKVSIQSGNESAEGTDRVEFLISMNKGEDLKPLTKTASGGELSRLMLGLKVIFTALQEVHTVIFDEIDTGVSGPVATAIGRKMRSLSEFCQVFSVTHLAPVAASAEYHYLVSKHTAGDRTITDVTLLDHQGTVDQLALISSGEITEASRTAAEELLERNRAGHE